VCVCKEWKAVISKKKFSSIPAANGEVTRYGTSLTCIGDVQGSNPRPFRLIALDNCATRLVVTRIVDTGRLPGREHHKPAGRQQRIKACQIQER
jgi:hypothetical protein